MPESEDGGTPTNPPLADYCSLCGTGYHPNLTITITDNPTKGEYRWIHDQCKRDHDRVFVNTLFKD